MDLKNGSADPSMYRLCIERGGYTIQRVMNGCSAGLKILKVVHLRQSKPGSETSKKQATTVIELLLQFRSSHVLTLVDEIN